MSTESFKCASLATVITELITWFFSCSPRSGAVTLDFSISMFSDKQKNVFYFLQKTSSVVGVFFSVLRPQNRVLLSSASAACIYVGFLSFSSSHKPLVSELTTAVEVLMNCPWSSVHQAPVPERYLAPSPKLSCLSIPRIMLTWFSEHTHKITGVQEIEENYNLENGTNLLFF